jgi:hypothetical protein
VSSAGAQQQPHEQHAVQNVLCVCNSALTNILTLSTCRQQQSLTIIGRPGHLSSGRKIENRRNPSLPYLSKENAAAGRRSSTKIRAPPPHQQQSAVFAFTA